MGRLLSVTLLLLISVMTLTSSEDICPEGIPRHMEDFSIKRYATSSWYTLKASETVVATPFGSPCAFLNFRVINDNVLTAFVSQYVHFQVETMNVTLDMPEGASTWSWTFQNIEIMHYPVSGTAEFYMIDTDYENYACLYMCAKFTAYGIYTFNVASQFIQGRKSTMDDDFYAIAKRSFNEVGYFIFQRVNQTKSFCKNHFQVVEWNPKSHE